MSNKLDVLCIDGATGVGKTTQIIIFRNLLNSLNIPNKVFSLKEVEDISYTKDQLIAISEYLRENPDSVVLVDGSIATDIVDDITTNMLKEDVWSKHKDNLQVYASMNSEFNIVNVLLTPNNIQMCYARIKKRTEVYNHEAVEIESEEHLRKTAIGLETFDNNVLTTNIKFHNIRVREDDSILEIHKSIQDIVKNTHQIKKPS